MQMYQENIRIVSCSIMAFLIYPHDTLDQPNHLPPLFAKECTNCLVACENDYCVVLLNLKETTLQTVIDRDWMGNFITVSRQVKE